MDSIRLITNNPHKVEELQRHGVKVDARIPIEVGHHAENLGYLRSKAERMAHLLSFREQVPQSHDYDFLDPLVSQLRLRRSGPQSRPWVTLVYAQTMDGKIFADQSSTNPGLARFLTLQHDAVLQEGKQALPGLPLATGSERFPLQVVLDPELEYVWDVKCLGDLNERLLLLARSADTSKKAQFLEAGVGLDFLPWDTAGHVDVPALLKVLVERGMTTVMVEAGPDLFAAFVRARAVDFCIASIVPEVRGEGVALSEGFAIRECEYQVLGSQLIAFGPVDFK